MFEYVTRHFTDFLARIQLTAAQRKDAETKAANLARRLHARYRPGRAFDESEFLIVGSYGKGTAVRPPSDIDMLYMLPIEVYGRYSERAGNIQSALLQEVKNVLLPSFPGTDIRADGPVISVPFITYEVELLPCFRVDVGSFAVCFTRDGGSWRFTWPYDQYRAVVQADQATGGKATHLVQMAKTWQRYTNAPIKSYALELLATEFVLQWQYRDKSIFWYDYLVRDFFQWLVLQANRAIVLPGATDSINTGTGWEYRARRAYEAAVEACDKEYGDYNYLAVEEWREIFGDDFRPAG